MLIPMLELKTLDGQAVPWNEWWQRRPVALFFTHESCETCEKALRELYEHRDEDLDPDSVRLVVHSDLAAHSDGAKAGHTEGSDKQSKNGERSPEISTEFWSANGEEGEVGRHHLVHIADPDGRFAKALHAKPGMVLAADRFFEVRTSLDVHQKKAGKAVDQVFQRIGLAEGECPECGAPVW